MTKIVKEALQRIQRYYESEASAESDLELNRDALVLYAQVVKDFGLRFNLQLLKDRNNGPFSLLLYKTPPFPTDLTTKSMVKVNASHYNPKYKFYIVFCFMANTKHIDTTGVFAPSGLDGYPTIFLYMPDFDGEELGYAATARLAISKNVKNNSLMRKSFGHEFTHYKDWLASLKGNPDAKMFSGYKRYDSATVNRNPKVGQKAEKSNATADYGAHINQMVEVNARYSEFLIDILYSFDQPSIKETGIENSFPNFNDFWDYYWTPDYAPDGLFQYAKPAIIKYLKKRLYKFYDYVKGMEKPAPTSKIEAKKRAQEYLRKDQSGN